MIYSLDVSSVASDEADRAALNIANVLGVGRAKDWYEGLLLAIDPLTAMLRRCPLAHSSTEAFHSSLTRFNSSSTFNSRLMASARRIRKAALGRRLWPRLLRLLQAIGEIGCES